MRGGRARRGGNPALPVLEASRWARGRTALERERALARRDGLWTSAGALRTALRVPDEENAAAVLMQAVGGAGISPPTAQDGIRMGDLPAETWREASKRPRLVFERPWDKPHEVLRPELASIKRAAKALIERGDPASVARLAALTAQEPEIVCQLVSIALGKMALRAASGSGRARELEALLGEPSLRYGLRSMALRLPPPLRPRRRFYPRCPSTIARLLGREDASSQWFGGTVRPVDPWNRRMAPAAADRFQTRTLRACRRLDRFLGTANEAEALRRSRVGIRERSKPYPFSRYSSDGFDAAQSAQAFADHRELRQAAWA